MLRMTLNSSTEVESALLSSSRLRTASSDIQIFADEPGLRDKQTDWTRIPLNHLVIKGCVPPWSAAAPESGGVVQERARPCRVAAQRIRHLDCNPKVAGSTPIGATHFRHHHHRCLGVGDLAVSQPSYNPGCMTVSVGLAQC